MCIYLINIDLDTQKCVFLSYTKSVNWFKFWDSILNKTVNYEDVFDKQSMLKKTTKIDVLASKE